MAGDSCVNSSTIVGHFNCCPLAQACARPKKGYGGTDHIVDYRYFRNGLRAIEDVCIDNSAQNINGDQEDLLDKCAIFCCRNKLLILIKRRYEE